MCLLMEEDQMSSLGKDTRENDYVEDKESN